MLNIHRKRHGAELVLALIVAAGSSTQMSGKRPRNASTDPAWLTLKVYDYSHQDRSALLEAEAESTRILGQAGINARWTDCPRSPSESSNYPDCKLPWLVNDYVLEVTTDARPALPGRSEEALGFTPKCAGLHCTTLMFYDRVERMASGSTAAAPVLLGRAMAHEIGHLLLGSNSHSDTGIMRASWSARELRLNAGPRMLFTDEQAQRMRMRLRERQDSPGAQSELSPDPH